MLNCFRKVFISKQVAEMFRELIALAGDSELEGGRSGTKGKVNEALFGGSSGVCSVRKFRSECSSVAGSCLLWRQD
jgi:hypothetical protein